MIGPHHPNGSIAKCTATMFLLMSSWMMLSLLMMCPSEECGLSCCKNFFLSKLCRCRLAEADKVETTLLKNWKEEFLTPL